MILNTIRHGEWWYTKRYDSKTWRTRIHYEDKIISGEYQVLWYLLSVSGTPGSLQCNQRKTQVFPTAVFFWHSRLINFIYFKFAHGPATITYLHCQRSNAVKLAAFTNYRPDSLRYTGNWRQWFWYYLGVKKRRWWQLIYHILTICS